MPKLTTHQLASTAFNPTSIFPMLQPRWASNSRALWVTRASGPARSLMPCTAFPSWASQHRHRRTSLIAPTLCLKELLARETSALHPSMIVPGELGFTESRSWSLFDFGTSMQILRKSSFGVFTFLDLMNSRKKSHAKSAPHLS